MITRFGIGSIVVALVAMCCTRTASAQQPPGIGGWIAPSSAMSPAGLIERLPPTDPVAEIIPPPEARLVQFQEFVDLPPEGNIAGAYPTAAVSHTPPADYQPPPYTWRWAPGSPLYKSYLAGPREPRIASQMVYSAGRGPIWDVVLGGRGGLLRYGTYGAQPEGFQLDVEGAAIARLDFDNSMDVDGTDYRAGFPLTWTQGAWQIKTGGYHISSHLGDEYMERNPDAERNHYVRDSFLLGAAYSPRDEVRLYGETSWAFSHKPPAEVWEFQFGAEFVDRSAPYHTAQPFAAINAHLREENDFGADVTIQAGWLWQNSQQGSIFRAGLHMYNGKATQYQFLEQHEKLYGFGVWYDF